MAQVSVTAPRGTAPYGPTSVPGGAAYRLTASLGGGERAADRAGACSCSQAIDVVDPGDYAATVAATRVPAAPLAPGSSFVVDVAVRSAAGRPVSQRVAGSGDYNDDVLRVTSSDPAVVALGAGLAGRVWVVPALHGDAPITWTLPPLQALQPGESTVTVRDVSNPGRPAARFRVTVGG